MTDRDESYIRELIGSIAHEIRNPLAGIKAAIQLLYESFPETDGRKAETQEIINEITRIEKLIKTYIDFAKPSSLSTQKENINEIIERVLLFVSKQAEIQKVKIKKELEKYMPKINVDANMIQQVLINIFINALNVMRKGGELSVVSGMQDGNVVVRISDTGPGIPEEVMDKIFNPFFTTKSDSIGLGLSIVIKIMEAHNGSVVAANNKNGKGSVFTLIFPA